MIVNTIKGNIIPDEMKSNIDEIIEIQLLNANRSYAESNGKIIELMELEANKSSIEFLKELKKRWQWHNRFYEELLEPAYTEIVENKVTELSLSRIDDIIDIYKTSSMVDSATLVTSGAIKRHLERKLSKLLETLENKEDIYMLLTPPEESFYIKYEIDHLLCVLVETENEKDKLRQYKNYLMQKYHANDEKIFAGRYEKYEKYQNMKDHEISKLIESLKMSKEYGINHFYFTFEHPERKAYSEIIKYDNVDEKLLASSLIGISGFLLRKKVLEYLNEEGLLINKGNIYEFEDEKIILCLNMLKEKREKNMDKDVKPYKQKGPTCAIACLLMVLEYYKKIPKADWNYEMQYYSAYHSKYMDGAPFSALAYHLSKNNFDVELVHSEENIFTNNNNFEDYIFSGAMEEYKKYINEGLDYGLKVKNGVEFNSKDLKKHLQEDNMIIVAGGNSNYLHAILITGYENSDFIVCDPEFKTKQIKSFEEIDNFMKTPIGKWFILVNNNKNKKNLMNSIPDFQKEALYMTDHNKIKTEEKVLSRK